MLQLFIDSWATLVTSSGVNIIQYQQIAINNYAFLMSHVIINWPIKR